MKRGAVIGWDIALIIGISLLLLLSGSNAQHQYLIAGILTGMILANCVRNHIAVYKLTGKLY